MEPGAIHRIRTTRTGSTDDFNKVFDSRRRANETVHFETPGKCKDVIRTELRMFRMTYLYSLARNSRL